MLSLTFNALVRSFVLCATFFFALVTSSQAQQRPPRIDFKDNIILRNGQPYASFTNVGTWNLPAYMVYAPNGKEVLMARVISDYDHFPNVNVNVRITFLETQQEAYTYTMVPMGKTLMRQFVLHDLIGAEGANLAMVNRYVLLNPRPRLEMQPMVLPSGNDNSLALMQQMQLMQMMQSNAAAGVGATENLHQLQMMQMLQMMQSDNGGRSAVMYPFLMNNAAPTAPAPVSPPSAAPQRNRQASIQMSGNEIYQDGQMICRISSQAKVEQGVQVDAHRFYAPNGTLIGELQIPQGGQTGNLRTMKDNQVHILNFIGSTPPQQCEEAARFLTDNTYL